VGGNHSSRQIRVDRGPSAAEHGDAALSDELEQVFRANWWRAVATLTRLVGDLALAEESVQEACAVALAEWPVSGLPTNPSAWLIGVARHKAIDAVRRETNRRDKERAAMADEPYSDDMELGDAAVLADDQLALIFTCCHPALDPIARVALTLRAVCGVPTKSIAGLLLMSEPTVAQRIVRAKRKIRVAGISLATPAEEARAERLAPVLGVVYLLFTEGHYARTGHQLVRGDLCDEALRLARALHVLLPADTEVGGLLALILLTDARRDGRLDGEGNLVLLEDQDRSRWNAAKMSEGLHLVEQTLARGRPGPYQVQAAIAACHAEARTADATDWRQIASLYGELLRYQPSPVIEANRAVAVAMAEGPSAGLTILDTLARSSELARWAQLHTARAQLLTKLGRTSDAITAYRMALALEPPQAECTFIAGRIAVLTIDPTGTLADDAEGRR
jgi:RNA polymerase sigma-70 factor, ECF subfamily